MDEHINNARRNSDQIRLVQTSWRPLFDHFPDFNNFGQIGQNGPIPQTVQIWPSGQASRLEPQDPRGAMFDPSCVFQPRCLWVGAKLFRRKIDFSQNQIGAPWISMFLN